MSTTETTTTTPAMAHAVNTFPSPFPNWADGPFPLIVTPIGKAPISTAHGSMCLAQGMAQIHNMFIRNLNAMYHQAPQVSQPQDIKDFVQFIRLWCDIVHHHHESEEAVFFPELEKLAGVSMQANIDQHAAFEGALTALHEWSKSTTPATYSAPALLGLIDALGPIFTVHLADEIPSLLALRPHDSAKLKKIWEQTGEYGRKTSGPMSATIPVMIGAFDVTYEGGAVLPDDMPLNWIFRQLTSWVLSRKYSGSWRFLPCDWNGKPRPLAFGPKA